MQNAKCKMQNSVTFREAKSIFILIAMFALAKQGCRGLRPLQKKDVVILRARPQNAEADRERDAYLAGLGIMVLRYKNRQINDYFESVCKDILKHIQNRSSL